MLTKTISSLVVAGMALYLPISSWAAEISVLPGNGTLTTAIANASPGDVLVLQPGGEFTSGADFVINKTLTLRGFSSASMPLITRSMYVNASQASAVVIQGLGFGAYLYLQQAGDIKILENKFYTGTFLDPSSYSTSAGDGTLTVIGNRFYGTAYLGSIYSRDAYIAGNTFDVGQIRSYVPVWVVGNNMGCHSDTIYVTGGTGITRVIGNRICHNYGSSSYRGIAVEAASALIVGNLITVTGGTGIYSLNYAQVFNNTVVGISGSLYSGIQASGEISGNIVVNMAYNGGKAIDGTGATYNLCFNNIDNTCGDNAVTTNPLFADAVDYRLSAGSPGINAGPTSPAMADLDATRNDMGAYGGPWSIEQYDAQRDPLYTAPFAYPLFDVTGLIVDGQLQVRALGMARLR